jgi:subtilisin family serine protease/subtilisin-like proprotein convertase family protein
MPRGSRRATPRSSRPPHALLRLELLEDRSLLDAGTQLLITLATGQLQTVPVPAGADVSQALAAWRARPGVRSAEVNQTLTISRLPDDSRFPDQWGLRNTGQAGGKPRADIDAVPAWDSFTGGTNKVVAVIDTGIDYTHPDLYRNIWINQQEIPLSRLRNLTDVDGDGLITFWDLNNPVNIGPGKITDLNGDGYIDAGDILQPMQRDGNGSDTGQGGWAYPGNTQDGDTAHPNDFVGWNFVNNTNDPFDDNGHGTHVAGSIGAVGNNENGVSGVNWKTQLAALKFLGPTGSGSLDGAVAALRYAVAHGIPVSNNSWGGATYSQALYDAISDAAAAGHIFVAAAGNAGTNNDRAPNYPASYGLPNIISVAATTRTDTLASFSNFGLTSVDLGAPGQQILSTVPGGRYAAYSGTSAAAPLVAGAAAFIWAQNPSLSYSDVISIIFRTVKPLPTLKGKVATGGRLDLARALEAAVPPTPDTDGAYVVSATAVGHYTVSGLRVSFSEAMNPGTFTADDVSLTDPDGTAIPVTGIQFVPGSGNTQFDLSFDPQTTPGQYAVTIGPDVRDAAGNKMDQNRNGINGEAEDVYAGTFQVPRRPLGPPLTRPGPRIVAVAPDGSSSVSGLRVTFNTVMDAASFTPDDVTVTDPNRANVAVTGVRLVPGSAGTQFDVLFAAQTVPGTYAYRIGPDVRDDSGNRMDQDGNGINGEDTDVYRSTFAVTSAARIDFTNGVRQAIQPFKTTASTIYVGQNLTIADVNVKLNITHPYDGQLVVSVRAPNGKITTLISYRGGAGRNFTGTTLDDEAGTGIAAGSAPFSGSFRPEAPLSGYAGLNATGYWTLFVYGGTRGNVGTLDSWTLSIQAGAFGGKLSLDSEAPLTPEFKETAGLTMLPTGLATAPELLPLWLAAERAAPAADVPAPRREDARAVARPIAEASAARADADSEPTVVTSGKKPAPGYGAPDLGDEDTDAITAAF